MALIDIASQLAGNALVLLALGTGLVVVYFVLLSIYRLTFHPLAKYPGPKLAAISELPTVFGVYRGRHMFNVKRWHEKYGAVVRISPNELSFSDPAAWKDIYSQKPNHPTFPKAALDSRVEKVKDGNIIAYDMLMADDPTHARQRRTLSHAFSMKAMLGQEPFVCGFVDTFVDKLGELSAEGETTDLNKWFNYLTFDIIGALAFGEPFGCMENDEFDDWVATMSGAMGAAAREQCTRRIAGSGTLIQTALKQALGLTAMGDHVTYSRDKVNKRLAKPQSEQKDFFWYIMREKEMGKLSSEELVANAALFILAGSETTASLLAGLTHWLMKTPSAFEMVKHELRSSIETTEEITYERLSKLPYFNACLDEGLRIFPPVAAGNLRAVPKGGATVAGCQLPEGVTVSVASYTATHLASNFEDPEAFIPERWMDEKRAAELHEASQPFSLGPRGCIGRNLAYLEMRLIMGKLIWHFDFEYAKDKGQEWDMTPNSKTVLSWITWHKPGQWIKLTPATK